MNAPDHTTPVTERSDASTSPLLRAAIWVAIGALIAAAIVCVVWVLIGSQNGIVGRAFLTILLLVGFAGVAILDAHLAPRRPAWFALASMASWVAALLIGAVLIWMPERYSWGGFTRFVQFLLIVLILQLALLHVRLYAKAFQRYVTPFTQTVAIVTISLVVALAALLIVPLVVNEWVDFPELYWRIVVAAAILAAVGTALIPLVNVLFAPKKQQAFPGPAYGHAPAVPATAHANQPAAAVPAAAPSPTAANPDDTGELLPWPTFVDGATPLPMMPDGSPDWGAYYTGYPSEGAQVFGYPQPAPYGSQSDAAPPVPASPAPPVPPAPAVPPAPSTAEEPAPRPAAPPAPAPEGFPPPPPLPPRP
jgi:hypothetical protein